MVQQTKCPHKGLATLCLTTALKWLCSLLLIANLMGASSVVAQSALLTGLELGYVEVLKTTLPYSFNDRGIEPFDEVEQFEPQSFIFQLGFSLLSDIDNPNQDLLTLQVPGVHLLMEKCILKNVGIGLKLGTNWWKADKLNYNYRYHSVGLRGTYHFNLLEKLDPYVGANLTGRYFRIGNGEEGVSELNVAPGLVFGTRYYLSDKIAAFAEFAEDGIGKIHLGFTLKIK